MIAIAQRPRPRNLYIVRGTDGIQEVFDKLKHGILAADTETTGLDWYNDRVGALCFAAGNTSAFFCRGALERAAVWFADQVSNRRPLVFHGGKFDMHVLRETFGIHIDYPVHDTLLMSRLLDNRGAPRGSFPFFTFQHDLDVLAKVFVDEHASDPYHALIDAVREKVGKHKAPAADWMVAPLRVAGLYGGLDPWYTLRLFDQFISRIAHWNQPPGYPSLMSLYQTERWLLLALRDMEERGVLLDHDFIHQWIKDATEQLRVLERKMHRKRCRWLDEDPDELEPMNWRSNPQVKSLLWEQLQLAKVNGDKANKRALLRMSHPVAALILQHRKLAKMISSGRALITNSRPDHSLHSWYNQNVDTGRMSATKGFHQFARDSGIRKGVIPRKGLVLRSADYSQIEMRFAAHYSNEKVLVHGFNTDPKFDTHSALARRMFGVKSKRMPTESQRGHGKTMNFSMLYGAGIDAVTEGLIDKITAEAAYASCIELGYRPGLSESPFRTLAQLLRDAVRDSYPRIWQFTKDEENFAKEFGFAIDAFGYHRYLEEDKAYKAFNSKLQGSAAHQAKAGMVDVYREVMLNLKSIGITMQVHDDIVYESEGDPRTDRLVLELLQELKRFRVPIVADLKGSAKNWQDKESIKLPQRKAA